MEPRFLLPSPAFHEMQVLLRVARDGALLLPLDPHDLPLPSLGDLSISRLIEEGKLAVVETGDGQSLVLTEGGRSHMRRLVIDYHLELIGLRGPSDQFFEGRVASLVAAGYRTILLYGASDTASAMVDFLGKSPIVVLGVIDDDPSKQGTFLRGLRVIGPAEIPDTGFDAIVVTTVAFEDRILREGPRRLPGGQKIVGLFELA